MSSIKATQLEEEGTQSRIFIALKQDLPYSITPDDSGLHISFPKTDKLTAEAAAQDTTVEKVEETAEPKPEKAPVPPATQITSITATPLKKNVVIDVKADGTIKNYKFFTIVRNSIPHCI